MTDSKALMLTHLPYLRRYARALTGSQEIGDRCVARLLTAQVEPIVDLPVDLATSDHPRRDLYRAFHLAFAAGGTAPDDETPAPESDQDRDPVAARLAELSPDRRQLLLLTTVEAFSVRDAGVIVGLDEAEARTQIDAARARMQAQRPTLVLIIEDEPVIALNLTDIVRRSGHAVAGVATTKREALQMALDARPGLVLCDIQLQDGSSGLDAAREILEAMAVPIIFITAFPERLLSGAAHEPTFLVTKPFNADTVTVTISQALLTQV